MKYVPETMQRVSVGDAEIEYSESGQGEPLLLVHAGVFGDWFLPLAASPTLDGFRVIRVHRAGYGPNAPAHHLTLGDHARHLATLADQLGLERIHYVGHSSSSLIGLELALARPDLVHSLILLEPAPCGGFRAPASEELGRDFIGPAMGMFAAGDVKQAFETFLRGVGGEGDHRELIESRLGRAGYERAIRDSAYFFADEVGACLEWQFGEAEAGRINQPVLVAEGGESGLLGPMSGQITELAAKLLPHAEIVIIEGVNHMLPLQDPEEVGRVIAAFARRHPISG